MEKLKQFIDSLLSLERVFPIIIFTLTLLTLIAYIRVREWDDCILLAGIMLVAYSWAFP
jgi:hypothetical protein